MKLANSQLKSTFNILEVVAQLQYPNALQAKKNSTFVVQAKCLVGTMLYTGE